MDICIFKTLIVSVNIVSDSLSQYKHFLL